MSHNTSIFATSAPQLDLHSDKTQTKWHSAFWSHTATYISVTCLRYKISYHLHVESKLWHKGTYPQNRSNQSILKEINPEYSLKDWCWSSRSNTLATWCEEPTHWKRPWCWDRLKAGGKGGDRGWDGWMAPLTQWTWVWANSGRWWRTGKPGVLQSMGK